jgi:hypothetical protein
MLMRRGRPGLIGTMARTAVIAGTATAVSGSVLRRQNAAAQAPQPYAAAPTTPPEEGDVYVQLVKLGELKTAGILDDAEFAAAKAKLLGI